MRLPVLESNDSIVRDLGARVRGDVRGSRVDRAMYAVDGSLYEVEPLAIVAPKDEEDVVAVVEYAHEHGLPLLPRGAGTSLAGQSVNRAIVLDFSRLMHAILEIDSEHRTARVQPGVVLDQFNRALAPSGLKFGPDVSTSTHATLGGMIGNSSAGAYSIVHGMTDEHVLAMNVVLADGSRCHLGVGEPAELVRAVARIVEPLACEIDAKFPKVMRNNGGYRLDDVLAELRASTPGTTDKVNLARFLAGSEGTLAVMSEATVRLVEKPSRVRLLALGFTTVAEACASVEALVASGASAVELMDEVIINGAASQPVHQRDVALLPRVNGELPGAVLLVEYHGEACEGALWAGETLVYDDQALQRRLWNVRKVGLGIISAAPGPKKALQGLEDCAVPLNRLVEFQSRFVELMRDHGTDGVFYAHASVGLLHIRPRFDLRSPVDRSSFRRLMDDVLALVLELDGSISGEHGDGRIRANLMRSAYGPAICEAFTAIKKIFDPEGLLNPDDIVATRDPFEALRERGEEPETETYFEWPQGGPLAAAEACNANGLCRRAEGGAMCPSYRVLLDERHVTRGRAVALKAAMRGEADWANADVHDALSLCLSCKACRSECPSNVDVAKLKAEFTAQRYRAMGSVPKEAKRLARTGAMARLASRLHPLPSLVLAAPGVESLAKRILGIAPSRSIPRPIKGMARGSFGAGPTVLLFPDCFTSSFEPHIAVAAVKVITALGYKVVIPEGSYCCGRTAVSGGVLEEARRQIEATATALAAHDASTIVVLEPSCLSAIKEEWQELKTSVDRRCMKDLASKACSIETFIAEHPRDIEVAPSEKPHVVHAHCHAKVELHVIGDALGRLGISEVSILDSGCCGMAGSFGYMKATDELSRAIAENSLGEAMGSLDGATLVAAGTSCRHQIADCFGVQALHPAEVAWSAVALPS